MDNAWIVGLGAIGAWLLVAGPLLQPVLELREQGVDRERWLPDEMTPPRPVSAWWWLLPPAAFWKRHRRQEAFRQAALTLLPASDVQRLLAFSNVARGWLTVASGATLIATKETWELVEILGWPHAVTWGIVGVALFASISNAALTTGRAAKVLEAAGGRDASASRSA